MAPTRNILLSHYQYDPLDRLTGTLGLQRFYNNTRLATLIEGERSLRFFEYDAQPLALQQLGATPGTALLATDSQASVLASLAPDASLFAHHYTPYGHRAAVNSLPGMPGFNGEQPEPVTGHYLLGQGYRAFNPVLMRFNSPDNLSPFGKGGINAYAYCQGDPANRTDPTGHFFGFLRNLWKGLRGVKTMKRTPSATHITRSGPAQGVPYIEAPSTRLVSRNTAPIKSTQPPKPVSRKERTRLNAEYNRNNDMIIASNRNIDSDNREFGTLTLNRNRNPEAHDMVMDELALRDNLLDRQHVLSMRLNGLPSYHIETGLPLYTDALATQLSQEKAIAKLRDTSTAMHW